MEAEIGLNLYRAAAFLDCDYEELREVCTQWALSHPVSLLELSWQVRRAAYTNSPLPFPLPITIDSTVRVVR